MLGGCGLDHIPQSWEGLFLDAPVRRNAGDSVLLKAHDPASDAALYSRRSPSGRTQAVLVRAGRDEAVVFDVGVGADTQIFSACLSWPWAVVVVVGMNGWNEYSVLARNLTDGEPYEVQRSGRGGNGEWLPGPMLFPVIHSGTLYLPKVEDDGIHSTLCGYELATRTVWSLPPRKGAACPILFDGLLIWREYADAGPLTRSAALDLASRRVVDPPPEIASLATASFLAGDGATLVWTEKGTPTSVIRVLARDRSLRSFDVPSAYPTYVTVSGRYASFYDQRPWLVDIMTGQYLPLTAEFGGADLSGSLLGVYSYSTDKTAASVAQVLDLGKAPLLAACRPR